MKLLSSIWLLAIIVFGVSGQQEDVTLSPEEQELEDRYEDVMESYCVEQDIPNHVIQAMEACDKQKQNRQIKAICEARTFGKGFTLNSKRRQLCEKGPEKQKTYHTCYAQEYRKAVKEGRLKGNNKRTGPPPLTREQWDRLPEAEKRKRRRQAEEVAQKLKVAFLEQLTCMEKVMERYGR